MLEFFTEKNLDELLIIWWLRTVQGHYSIEHEV